MTIEIENVVIDFLNSYSQHNIDRSISFFLMIVSIAT